MRTGTDKSLRDFNNVSKMDVRVIKKYNEDVLNFAPLAVVQGRAAVQERIDSMCFLSADFFLEVLDDGAYV